MRPLWTGVLVCSLAACLSSVACGSTRHGEPGDPGEVAEAGSSGDGGRAGASSGGTAGASALAGTAGAGGMVLQIGTAGANGGLPLEPSEEPLPEPHAAMPCDDPQPYPLGGGYLVCKDKSLRVGERSDCPSVLPRDKPTDPLFFEDCALDIDCTAAAHGFCAYGQCKYGCVSDDECGAQGLCFCGAQIGTCVSAGCRSDADCPPDYPCTGNQPFGYDTATFSCQSPVDTCQSDYDCPGARVHCVSDGERRHCVRDTVG